jgi:hypothetical protein
VTDAAHVRPRTAILAAAAAILVLCAFAFGLAWLDGLDDLPDRNETVGPFALVTHRGGVDRFTVRHRGEPVRVRRQHGTFGNTAVEYVVFNSAITFPSREPVIVVNAGDPNNESGFYLVREQDGRPLVEHVGTTRGGVVSADWVRPAPAGQPPVRDLTVKRARLGAGRWLLLGEFIVLDVESFVARTLPQPAGAYLDQFRLPIAVSPDGRQFVRLASGESPASAPLLVVFDLETTSADIVPIDRARMRIARLEDLDEDWLRHYFGWQPAPDGSHRLVPAPDAAPRPWQGRLTIEPGSGRRQYALEPVSETMERVLVGFVEGEFGGERLPHPEYHGGGERLRLGDRVVAVFYSSPRLSVWLDEGTSSRIVAEIGRRFDEVLASGVHDDLFQPGISDD